MNKINWKIRLRQKPFLVAMFSGLLLLAQQVAKFLGYELSETIGEQLTDIFNTVLFILTMAGVIIDPTTKGLGDSEQAKEYTEPK
jgi:phi LC3 family holin